MATTWDYHGQIEEAVARFNGTRLVAVTVDADARSLNTLFEFEHELRLAIGPNSDDEATDANWWLLFTPGEQALVVGPAPRWSYKSAHEP